MEAYRRDLKSNHSLFTKDEREELLAPHLPPTPRSRILNGKINTLRYIADDELNSHNGSRAKIFLKTQLYAVCSLVLHTIFSIYIQLRLIRHAIVSQIFATLYYHHRAPELIQKDAKGLGRLPTHLSVILNLNGRRAEGTGLRDLLDKVAELSAWCACVGIPVVSIYEKTGVLKGCISTTHSAITKKLSSYLGPRQPALSVRAPHTPSVESPATAPNIRSSRSSLEYLSVLLLSAEDGRDSLVDLTKTLAKMAQHDKLSLNDINTDLIEAEISESVMSDPDLLILFTPSVELSGYPPWQIRLTEIFHVEDNQTFGYPIFLRALFSYANAQMRFGR